MRGASLRHRRAAVLLGLLVFAAVVVPLVWGNDPYTMTIAVVVCFNVALAQSLNLVTGFAGAVALCQASLYGIGAYVAGLLTVNSGVNPWLALVAATLAAAVAGGLLGLVTVRISGAYFTIATIGLQQIVQAILVKWHSLTGGTQGVVGILPPTLFGKQLEPGTSFYLLALAWVVVVVVIVLRIRASRLGAELVAVREDEDAARAAGVRTVLLRVICFVVGAAMAGLTGALYGYYQSTIDPSVFGLTLSATVLVMVILGGRASVIGVTIAAIMLTVLPEELQALQNYRLVVYGAVLIALVVFLPHGLVGLDLRLRQRLASRRTVRRPQEAAG
jgi:ABC-type branched-subunit amino acid transport system permease subunit